MQKPKKRHVPSSATSPRPSEITRTKGRVLSSYRIDALPVNNQLLERMRLDKFLRSYLPCADRRCRIAPALEISLFSREPLYGIGEWAARFAPQALGFNDSQLGAEHRITASFDHLEKAISVAGDSGVSFELLI